MIRINLLPIREIKRKEEARQQFFIFVISVVSGLAVMGGVALHLLNRVEHLNAEIKKVEDEKVKYQAIIAQMDKLKNDKTLLDKKLGIIASLSTQSKIPVRILAEIATTIPENRLWLNNLSQTESRLQVQGVALDNATIATYMKHLDDSPYFEEVDLASSSQFAMADQKLKSFSLACKIVNPDAPAPNAAAQGK